MTPELLLQTLDTEFPGLTPEQREAVLDKAPPSVMSNTIRLPRVLAREALVLWIRDHYLNRDEHADESMTPGMNAEALWGATKRMESLLRKGHPLP